MNWIFLGIVLVAFATAAWRQLAFVAVEGAQAPMEALSAAMIASAGGAVPVEKAIAGGTALSSATARSAASPSAVSFRSESISSRSASVNDTPEIHSACFTIPAVTFAAPSASAQSARPKTAVPAPAPARSATSRRRSRSTLPAFSIMHGLLFPAETPGRPPPSQMLNYRRLGSRSPLPRLRGTRAGHGTKAAGTERE